MSSFCLTFSGLNLQPRKKVRNRPSSMLKRTREEKRHGLLVEMMDLTSDKVNLHRIKRMASDITTMDAYPCLLVGEVASPTIHGLRRHPC